MEKKEARERDIAESLTKYNKEIHPRGETLPQEQQVYRVNVVSAFLKAGVPLNKIDCFRDLLEENALRLTDRRNMHHSYLVKKKAVFTPKLQAKRFQ